MVHDYSLVYMNSINSTNVGHCRVLLVMLQQTLHYNAHASLCDVQIMSHNDVILSQCDALVVLIIVLYKDNTKMVQLTSYVWVANALFWSSEARLEYMVGFILKVGLVWLD